MTPLLGKTIQIYLPDGNPRGVRIAEITSRTVQAMLVPRAQLDFACSRSELGNVGIYFLVGDSEDREKPLLYVGEAEDCGARLKQQNKAKDFWNAALVVISKTHYFTKTHAKYLEWHCHEEAQRAGRFQMENSTIPTRPYAAEWMESDLRDNFDTLKVLVSTLGYPLFDEIKEPLTDEILFVRGKGVVARGEYTEDGLVIFRGSTAYLAETPSASNWIRRLRSGLIETGVLIKENAAYRFSSDHIFSAPSAAAGVVLGKNVNGWLEWKYADGRSLDEVKRPAPSED
jgi:hypothetical protein